MVIAILLVIIVLLQSSKGGGLAGTFGGAGGASSMFGARRTSDFLSKATWWLAGSLGVLAIVINLFFLPGKATSDQRDSIIQRTQKIPQTGSVPVQQAPAQQTAPRTK